MLILIFKFILFSLFKLLMIKLKTEENQITV